MSYDDTPDEPGWRVYRVGQGILLEGDKVLLSGNRWFRNQPLVWTLPGGRAEEGEGVAEALVREFEEETGMRVEVEALAFVAEARSAVSRQIFLTCAFTVERVSGSLTCGSDAAVEELLFAPITDLARYLPKPSLGAPLRWYLERRNERARYWFFPEYSSE